MMLIDEARRKEQFAQLLRNEYGRLGALHFLENKRHMTPAEFAQALNASPESVEAWLAGERLPEAGDLGRLPGSIAAAARQVLLGS